MYEIENGIPVPPKKRAGMQKSLLRQQMEALAVGQSIFVPGGKNNRVSTVVYAVQKKTGGSFTTRCVDGGIRVWRVEDPAPVTKLRAAE